MDVILNNSKNEKYERFTHGDDILIIDNCHKELIMDVLDSWSVSFVNTRDSGEMNKEINMICLLFAVMKILYHRDFRNQASYFNHYIDIFICNSNFETALTWLAVFFINAKIYLI